VPFGPAAAGERYRDAAGAGPDQPGIHVAQRLGSAEWNIGGFGATFGSGVEPGRRAAGETVWDYEFSSRSGPDLGGFDRSFTECGGAGDGAATGDEQPDGGVWFERGFQATAGDPSGIQRKPQCVDRGVARLQRDVRYRLKNQ